VELREYIKDRAIFLLKCLHSLVLNSAHRVGKGFDRLEALLGLRLEGTKVWLVAEVGRDILKGRSTGRGDFRH